MELVADIPDKLGILFENHHYKVAYGGRGSGKSWSFARALIIQSMQAPLRILCTREVQKSIRQSVHTLLSDQIQALGVGSYFEVTNEYIKCRNGSTFTFAGLSQHTVESIKSYEGVDRCWVEEAQTVSKRSWDILLPTIRKPDSEIWVSLNPDLDSDETYMRFVTSPPPDSVVVKVNYSDNPWFPDVLEKMRLHAQQTMSRADYENIWEGVCRPAAEGAIYHDEIVSATEGGHICNVPYDPKLKVHVIFDLGWNDSMSIILAQRHLSEIRVIEYLEDSHKTLDHYSGLLKNKMLNWGKVFLPHDGETKDYKTGKSAQQIMQELGWQVAIVPRSDIEQGIKVARRSFGSIYFDRSKTERLITCLKRYRRRVNQTTNEPSEPLHDEYSHGADCFRYLCLSAEKMVNEGWKPINYNTSGRLYAR